MPIQILMMYYRGKLYHAFSFGLASGGRDDDGEAQFTAVTWPMDWNTPSQDHAA
jgi:hypothetical protein